MPPLHCVEGLEIAAFAEDGLAYELRVRTQTDSLAGNTFPEAKKISNHYRNT
jgi:hypothetical protein